MPEGPEVKKLTLYLRKYILNEKLIDIIINNGRYNKYQNIKNYNNIIYELPLLVQDVNSKGKFIYIKFNKNIVLFITLGMTGYFRITNNDYIDKHDNVSFIFNKLIFHFNDYRNFGTLMFMNYNDLNKKLSFLGPDILDEKPNLDLFIKRTRKKKSTGFIINMLLDQKVLSGCGNYLRCDSLYLAKLNPYTMIKNINDNTLLKIFNILQQLAWFKYNEKKGRQLNIINDKYINKYNDFIVYHKKNVGKYNVIREKLNNRTIHWVKEIQK